MIFQKKRYQVYGKLFENLTCFEYEAATFSQQQVSWSFPTRGLSFQERFRVHSCMNVRARDPYHAE